MQKTLVSIIIPNFNKSNFVKETLLSLMAQTCANFEVVIVDDASTDDSVRVIEETIKDDARFRLIKQAQGHGGSAARNLGFANSSGEFVMFFDSDDLLAPTCLEKRVEKFKEAQYRDFDFLVFAMGCFYDTPENCYHRSCPSVSKSHLKMILQHQIPWSVMQPLWKRDALAMLKCGSGPFDEDYTRLQDVELHTRALLNFKIKYAIVNDATIDCFYRTIENRSTLSLERQLENKMLGFLTYFQKISLILSSNPKYFHYRRNLFGTLFEAWHQLCRAYEMGQVSISFFEKQKTVIQACLVRLNSFSWKLKSWYWMYEFAFLKCKAYKIKGFNWIMKRLIQM